MHAWVGGECTHELKIVVVSGRAGRGLGLGKKKTDLQLGKHFIS